MRRPVARVAPVVLALALASTASAATNNIFTVAGASPGGYGGDDGPATAAQLAFPLAAAETADGGFLIADQGNDRVRRVSPAGTITTVAGTGTPGFSGDDGPATGAQLRDPSGLAVTPDGGYLIVDQGNNRVRRVSPGGTITTVAGSGTPGFSGDDGPATAAQLNVPWGVAATPDGGFLIADFLNNRVRRVSPGGTITTVAGTGASGFSGDNGPATAAALSLPSGVAATADGGFLIADRENDRVRRVSPAGTITTVAGTTTAGFAGDGGPATAAQLNLASGVATTTDGGYLIADNGNSRVRRVSPAGTITTVAGTGGVGFTGDGGPATMAQIGGPWAVAATAEGGFLIPDFSNHRVRFVDADLRVPDAGPTGPAGAQGPAGPAGPPGTTNAVGRLRLGAVDGRLRARAGGAVTLRYTTTRAAAVELRVLGDGASSGASGGMPVRAATGCIYARPGCPAATGSCSRHEETTGSVPPRESVSSWRGGAEMSVHRVVARIAPVIAALALAPAAGGATNSIFTVAGDGTGAFGGDGFAAIAAQLNQPRGVAAMADGGFLIADTDNSRVRRVGPDGKITTVAGTGAIGFSGDDGPATAAAVAAPWGVAATADGGFLIADTNNQRVRRVSPTGKITTVAGNGTSGYSGDDGPATAAALSIPLGVSELPDGGFLIAEFSNNRVRRVSPGGTITTAAGTGVAGSAGDDGPATAAQLNQPSAVAATADGGFLVSETSGHRVRRVWPDGMITTVAGTGMGGSSGDGGPASAAMISTPVGVAVTPDGGFLITVNNSNQVRRVSPGGTITTVAGSGVFGFAGDGGPAMAAEFKAPWGVAATAEGGFLVTDRSNHRVRFVDADLRSPGAGPQGPPGSQGPSGAVGPPGETRLVEPLLLATVDARLRARAGRRVTLRYVTTVAAEVELRVLRGRRRVKTVRGHARAGHNRLRLRAPRAAGRYRLVLQARGNDDQQATAGVPLVVAARR